jgi:hypothetical protein
MKPNSILKRGKNKTLLLAVDMSTNSFTQLEFYRRYPIRLNDIPLINWDGKDEAWYYYNSKPFQIKNWQLTIENIIESTIFKASKQNPLIITNFKAVPEINIY